MICTTVIVIHDVIVLLFLMKTDISSATVAFAIGSIEASLFNDARGQASALAFLGTFAAVIGYALLGEVVGQRGLVDVELLRVALIAGILNAAIAPVMVRPMRWALRGPLTFGAAAPTRS